MATVDDYAATSMPKAFLVVTASLIVLRIATSLMGAMSPPVSTGSSVNWEAPTNYASLPPKQGKLVLYQFYAAWSDPCKRMDQTALSNRQVTEMVGEKFLPIRIVDVTREKGKNPKYISELEKRYRVFALPTLVVVDESGDSIGALIGDCSSLTTYRFLSRAIHKQPPIKTVSFALPQHSFPKKTSP